MFYKAKWEVIKLFDDYIRIVSKAKYEGKNGTRLKLLNFKEML